jgi:hypothetical protein
MGKMGHAYRILFAQPEGKRPLGRPGHGWDDNIVMDFKKYYVRVWTAFIWLRRSSGWPLWSW